MAVVSQYPSVSGQPAVFPVLHGLQSFIGLGSGICTGSVTVGVRSIDGADVVRPPLREPALDALGDLEALLVGTWAATEETAAAAA